MNQTIPLSSLALSRNDSGTRLTIAMRGILICLLALFTTGVWGAILHFGTHAIGFPIGTAWLATALAVIFILVLLILSMAAVASGHPDRGDNEPPLDS